MPVSQPIEHEANARGPGSEVAQLTPPIAAAVLVNGDMIEVRKRKPRLAQAIGDGLRGEARPVLDAPEAFLLGRRDEHAVAHQRGCGVAVEGVEAEDDHVLDTGTNKRFMTRTVAGSG
jgi:hypothetical protein